MPLLKCLHALCRNGVHVSATAALKLQAVHRMSKMLTLPNGCMHAEGITETRVAWLYAVIISLPAAADLTCMLTCRVR